MKKYSILLIISILSIMLIAGCGGGGSTGVIPNNGSVTTIDPTATPGTLVEVPGNPTATPGSTIPSNLPTGTFKVEVQFPGSGSGLRAKDLTGSDLPYNSHTLRVTITGEAIATSIVGERNDLDPTGAGTYTLTVSNVPVGLNTATIEVLDPSGNLLCQRKHGFYMTPGATEGPGLILLGVAIQGDGSYVPQNIDIPAGSSISFQNHDYTNDRTASMNGGAVTVGPIGHATHITQPVTAEVFPAINNLFNTQGQFDYDGQTGRVLVYGLPTLTSVTPDKDSTNGTTDVSFTLAGTNFGTSQASVNGAVRFIQVNENDPNNPWGTVYNPSSFTSWSNTSIAGTINLPSGKYRIEVSARGENTTETVFFYKGTGNYQVIVGNGWYPAGNPGFSPGQVGEVGLCCNNETPYVFFRDNDNSGKLSVMKFNGTVWDFVGSPGFSEEDVGYLWSYIYNGIPYASYRDGAGAKLTVKKFNGTAWETVGSRQFSPGTVEWNSLCVDSNTGILYTAFQDGGMSYKATVMAYTGTGPYSGWELVGTRGFSDGFEWDTNIVIDQGVPYVGYKDGSQSMKATVMKFNGTSWVPVGNKGFSQGNAAPVLKIYNHTLYAALYDAGIGNKISVMKFNGSAWEYIGNAGFVSASSNVIGLSIDNNGILYVSYKNTENKISVMKFNGSSWVLAGNSGFSDGNIEFPRICLAGNTPYVAYKDLTNGNKVTVMKLK